MKRTFFLIALTGAALLPPFYPGFAAEAVEIAAVKADEVKKDESKKEEPKKDETKKDEVKKEEAKAVVPAAAISPAMSYGRDYIGDEKTYVTKYEDTLVQLSRDNNIGFVELRSANPDVDPWLPGEGVKLTIPTRHLMPDAPRKGVIINLPEMRLYYFAGKGAAPVTYPIGIGREGLKTPVGSTTVRDKKAGPTWRPTPRMRLEDPTLPIEVPPGPENPMGTHAMYLGWPEYAIHGTNKPFGIGRRSSSGCIRMYPEDIVKLFPVVAVGQTVTVVDQPVKAGWIGEKLYIEAHPTMAQANRMEEEGGRPSYEIGEDDMKRIMRTAGPHAASLDWQTIRKVVRERRGYPVAVGYKVAGVVEAKVEAPAADSAPAKDIKAVETKKPTATSAAKKEAKKTDVAKGKAATEPAKAEDKAEKSLIPWLKKRGVNTEEKAPEKPAEKKSSPAKKGDEAAPKKRHTSEI